MKIVMLNGLARSGKDTAGNIFSNMGYSRQSFAEPIRKLVMEICGFRDLDELDVHKNSHLDVLGGNTPRYAMQTLGTEWGRDTINDSIWPQVVINKIKSIPSEKFVITDVRFDNEYHSIVKAFPDAKIYTYEVIRPDNTSSLTGQAASHRSESGLSDDIKREIILNDGYLKEFLEKIKNIAIEIEHN